MWWLRAQNAICVGQVGGGVISVEVGSNIATAQGQSNGSVAKGVWLSLIWQFYSDDIGTTNVHIEVLQVRAQNVLRQDVHVWQTDKQTYWCVGVIRTISGVLLLTQYNSTVQNCTKLIQQMIQKCWQDAPIACQHVLTVLHNNWTHLNPQNVIPNKMQSESVLVTFRVICKMFSLHY
jgi:hypothetical protein